MGGRYPLVSVPDRISPDAFGRLLEPEHHDIPQRTSLFLTIGHHIERVIRYVLSIVPVTISRERSLDGNLVPHRVACGVPYLGQIYQ